MKTFWLSWWDDPDAGAGKHVDGIAVWGSGEDTKGRESVCALVVAKTEDEAWDKADRYYPGAKTSERRFSQAHHPGWRPGDRFPLSKTKAAEIANAEGHA